MNDEALKALIQAMNNEFSPLNLTAEEWLDKWMSWVGGAIGRGHRGGGISAAKGKLVSEELVRLFDQCYI